MNERINELFGQALDQAVPETWTTLNPAQLSKLKEKFARLIVRECAEIADKAEPYKASNLIKQHFGVELDVNETLRNRSTYFGNNI